MSSVLMAKRSDRVKGAKPRPDPRTKSEEDLQPKDPSEMPLEPQDPVQPPDPAS